MNATVRRMIGGGLLAVMVAPGADVYWHHNAWIIAGYGVLAGLVVAAIGPRGKKP